MPLAVHDGRTIFFAHVPKTGGTSVEDYLRRRFGPLGLMDRADGPPRRRRHGDLASPVQHMTAADLRHVLPPRIDYSFAMVRDPLSRIKSEYRYQFGSSRPSRLDFSTWLRIVLTAAGREPRLYNNHIRPQSELVPEGTEIFRLEDGFGALIARLDEISGTTAPELEMRHRLKRSGRETAPLVLRRPDVVLVSRFYEADYARFNYPMPDPMAFPEDALSPVRQAFAALAGPMVAAKQRRDKAGR